jgi:hypothetical protein
LDWRALDSGEVRVHAQRIELSTLPRALRWAILITRIDPPS